MSGRDLLEERELVFVRHGGGFFPPARQLAVGDEGKGLGRLRLFRLLCHRQYDHRLKLLGSQVLLGWRLPLLALGVQEGHLLKDSTDVLHLALDRKSVV